MAETRKIAAILAADVVGFSRMTSADEDGTLARLRALRRDLIDPTVASQKGRVFKRTGDGALIEFRGVVEAVRCAIQIQNAMVERNSGVAPDRRIEFRISADHRTVINRAVSRVCSECAARSSETSRPSARMIQIHRRCLQEDVNHGATCYLSRS